MFINFITVFGMVAKKCSLGFAKGWSRLFSECRAKPNHEKHGKVVPFAGWHSFL